MSRKKKLFLNTAAGITKQIATVICGFILPRYMLLYYGSNVNGLVSSIAHFLSFISLLDLGVGSVIQANLYKPLAENDNYRISVIAASSQRFFRHLAYIFIVYILILAALLPGAINTDFDFLYIATLIVIIAISSLVQFLVGMTNELLLFADQRGYITISMQIGTVVLNTIGCIVLMKTGASIHAVKLLTAFFFVLRPIGQYYYVKNHYKIDKHVKFEGEPIKQKWNGLSQHFASVVCENIDVVLLSLFSTLGNVSVYSVYYMITNGVTMIIMTAANGLESLFGNMIAKGEEDVLEETFSTVEWFIHFLVTVVFSTAAVLLIPFITVYTKGISDVNYIEPAFGAMLIAAYATQCLRIPYFRIIKAAGHFKETQNGAFISACLNILVSISLIFRFGLVGIAFGTFVAMLYHTCYFVWYLQKNILCRSPKYFVFYIVSDAICCILIILITRTFNLSNLTYISWAIMAIKTGIVSLCVAVTMNCVFYNKQIKVLLRILSNKSRE